MASTPSAGDSHMDKLPDEIFARILNLLPIRQVIRCADVSMRWDAACRDIIRRRESLIIGYGRSYRFRDATTRKRDCHRERRSQQPDGRTLTYNALVPEMTEILNQMQKLKRLCVHSPPIRPADVSPFIRRFANQLTMLEIDFAVSILGADAVFPHLTRLRCRDFDANAATAFPKLAELIICGLQFSRTILPNMRLSNLKSLIIDKVHDGTEWLVRGFIVANSVNLTVLKMAEFSLQLDAVVFPDLVELDCMEVDVVAGRCAFPALTRLTVESASRVLLSSLPADLMRSLWVKVGRQDENLVAIISRMRKLNNLMLTGVGWDDETVSSLFDKIHQLEKVQLHAYDFSSKQDETIATLVNQNPNLSSVSFCHLSLTDAELTSLAQLQHLTDVSVYGYQTNVTTAGVLTLLRGSSRKVIRNLSICKEKVDYDPVISEIGLMCEERVTTFDADVTKDSFMFHIHN